MKTKLKINALELYQNCLFSSIAHAVSNLKYPFFSYAQSWDGYTYNFNDDYERGSITFDLNSGTIVGAMRADKSDRLSWYPEFKAIELFAEAPEKAKVLAENEAIQYLFFGVDEVSLPVATTALWNEGEDIFSCDVLNDFIINGGEFISNIIIPIQELRVYWEERYELGSVELELIDNIFILRKNNNMIINKRDIAFIDKRQEGYKEFIKSLNEIGFKIK